MVNEAAIAFGVILLAELGDKSQLMAVGFAARYPAWIVLAGVALATGLLNALSVLVGTIFAVTLPTDIIQIAAGVLFLGFAAWTALRHDNEEADGSALNARRGVALLTIAVAYAVAELGDKTMVATIALATTHDPVPTWVGATAAMVAANAVAITVGALLGARLPERAIELVSAAAFAVFGGWLLLEGFGVLS